MRSKLTYFSKLVLPFKYKKIYKEYKGKEINYLDIGCGSDSPHTTKIISPKCKYYGLDIKKDHIQPKDLDAMEKFYHLNLMKDDISEMPDDYFDIVNITHVIEHITNSYEVLEKLIPKLKKGGKYYIEFPSVRSLSFPSKPGTLNFCDDDTHIFLPSVREVANLLLANNFKIIKGGLRRDKIRIMLAPLYYIVDRVYYKHGYAGAYWDILGFAEYVYAEKRKD